MAENQITNTRDSAEVRKIKGVICKLSEVCLEAVPQERGKFTHGMQDLGYEIEGCKSTELVLSIRIEQLLKQPRDSQLKQQEMGKHVEIMLIQSLNHPRHNSNQKINYVSRRP